MDGRWCGGGDEREKEKRRERIRGGGVERDKNRKREKKILIVLFFRH